MMGQIATPFRLAPPSSMDLIFEATGFSARHDRHLQASPGRWRAQERPPDTLRRPHQRPESVAERPLPRTGERKPKSLRRDEQRRPAPLASGGDDCEFRRSINNETTIRETADRSRARARTHIVAPTNYRLHLKATHAKTSGWDLASRALLRFIPEGPRGVPGKQDCGSVVAVGQ